METLRIIIGDLNNEDLPVFGRTSLGISSRGNGLGLLKLKFGLSDGRPNLILVGDAEFTTITGSSLGKSIQLATDGICYIKAISGDSTLLINDSLSIIGVGISTEVFSTRLDSVNSPALIVDLASLLAGSSASIVNQPISTGMSINLAELGDKENMTFFNVPNSGGGVNYGSIDALSNFNLNHLRLSGNINIGGSVTALTLMTNLTYLALDSTSISGNLNFLNTFTELTQMFLHVTLISVDLKNLPALLHTVRSSGNTSFTGDENTFIGRNFQWIEANLNVLPTAQLDNLIKACDKATFTGIKRLRLKGTRSVDSDVAFNSLISKGVDVSIVP